MDPMRLSVFSVVLFRRWFSRVVKNAPIVPSPVAKLSSVLVTDGSLEEWGAMLFLGSGEVGAAGGAWSSTPPTIAAAEVRAVHLNLCAFAHRLEDHIALRVDNTTVQHTLLKKSTKSQA
jgi:hypothetical protein